MRTTMSGLSTLSVALSGMASVIMPTKKKLLVFHQIKVVRVR